MIVRAGVERGAVDQQAKGCAELFACSGVVVVFAGEAAVDVMRALKLALDPENLLNPGKILP